MRHVKLYGYFRSSAAYRCRIAFNLKGVAPEYADRVNFVHVEPYQLQQTDTGLQPLLDATGNLQPVQAVLDYGLPTEPYQFVVDGSGIVRAALQGIATADEIRAALDSVLAPAG